MTVSPGHISVALANQTGVDLTRAFRESLEKKCNRDRHRFDSLKRDADTTSNTAQYYEKAGHLGLPAALYIAATHKQSKPQKFIDYIRQASSVNYLPAVEYLTQEAIDDYRNLYRENLRVKTKLNRARDKAYSMVKRATELGSSKSKHFQQQLDKLK